MGLTDGDAKVFKAVWEMLTAPRFQKYWYILIAFNIIFTVTVLTMDSLFPRRVCFCDCDYSNGLKVCGLDGQKALIKRWGVLEDCVKVCDREGLVLIDETNYSVYEERVKGCNAQISNYINWTGGSMIN